MRVGMAILCTVAMLFLLRFLAALLGESLYLPHSRQRKRLAPSRRFGDRGNLIAMNSAKLREDRPGTDHRIAL